jgi:radical SAM superfamily enzyme YgiQ (UPF0313 family)
METLVYYLICPPHWNKTLPLSGEYLSKYATKKKISIKILDLNIILYKRLRLEKKTWLTLNKNFETGLFSAVKNKYPLFLENILKMLSCADAIGFSLFQRNKHFTFSLIDEIRSMYPNKKIIIGGPETLFMKLKKETLSRDIHWVIGEGEKSIAAILNNNTNTIIEYDELNDLDQIPLLDFDQYDIPLYSPTLPLYSSRGCIRNCTFCTERLLFSKFRQHSPLYMVEQIELLMRKYNLSSFSFQDSLINASPHWLEEFCRLLLNKNIKIKWEAQAAIRSDFKQPLAQVIKDSGCYNLFIGLESASDKILKSMNKGFTQEQAINFLTTLTRVGLNHEISLIVGFPGEESKDFQETLTWIKTHKKIVNKIAQVNPYLDYLSGEISAQEADLEKVTTILNTIRRERIPYTKSFINNLTYDHGH